MICRAIEDHSPVQEMKQVAQHGYAAREFFAMGELRMRGEMKRALYRLLLPGGDEDASIPKQGRSLLCNALAADNYNDRLRIVSVRPRR